MNRCFNWSWSSCSLPLTCQRLSWDDPAAPLGQTLFYATLNLHPRRPFTVLGVHVPVVPGHVRNGLQLRLGVGLQQRLLVLGVVLHAAVGLPLAQALGVGRVQLLHAVAAAVQPAGGRLLHHPGQPGRGERQHVQEHPGQFPASGAFPQEWHHCLVTLNVGLHPWWWWCWWWWWWCCRWRVRTRRQRWSGRPWSNTTWSGRRPRTTSWCRRSQRTKVNDQVVSINPARFLGSRLKIWLSIGSFRLWF